MRTQKRIEALDESQFGHPVSLLDTDFDSAWAPQHEYESPVDLDAWRKERES